MQVFGSSGTRGVANEELTPAFALRVAKAAGSVREASRFAVGRDTRETGRMLENAVASGLAAVGADVDRLGVVPTPGLQAYAADEGVPAIMVTASHNPPAYNGLKLVGADGVELAVEALERVEEALLSEAFETVAWDETGRDRDVEGTNRRYVERVCGAVDAERVAEADLTVALDPGHGAGALTSPDVYRELGCRVVTVNGQPDGHFPGRDPEPVPANLDDLGRLVRASGADVGIAHDGDADRAVFYDEDGEPIDASASFAALAAAELDAGDTAVSAVNVSQRLVDVCEAAGAELELTPIGSTRIMTRIAQLEAEGAHVPIAGEGNGGVIFPDYRVSRDGAYIGARFLELLAADEGRASDVVAPYDDYANVRVNVEYEGEAEREALLAAAEAYADDAAAADDAGLTTIDGYRLDYGDAWVLARPSGTEPVVRVYAEARAETRARGLAEDVAAALRAALD
ncbi:phosphomannomutase/phosphoglucomutase [Halarchaeum rubridurum]|uniref:Phosphoglucosamine mutase n=1 Tax=Halarchaeum rubridurum TaxID=489911 RepID=A0A830FTD6_9EURY|nr:phosphoglucosamine mutase [Halarchaeum rubridurum]MBP1954221.1 phosphomannomutase/phosphoglucomutase [Halarchaeum rubridurum]GGM58273.1 phosphoglucosamine mutase [Halarchaeum rubridurum]